MTNLKEKKLAIYEWFAKLDDDKIIEQIFSIMSGQQHSNNLSEAEIKRIEKGIDELNSGKSVSHKELRNKVNELFDNYKK